MCGTPEGGVRTLPGADFLCLILQHVLPKGFRRARNYGFLHPNKKGLIALLHIVLRVKPRIPLAEAKPRPKFLCTCCGAPMMVKRRRLPPAPVDRRRSADLALELAV